MFSRTELLLGKEALQRLSALRVIVFGTGGVGSWCAEALVRAGIGNITIVDDDTVAVSNLNRQLCALHSTLGQAKVDVMARRLADINPQCRITAMRSRYTPETSAAFALQDYDVVIDAIDSLADKAHLILTVTALPRTTALFSSMGAALKTDAALIADAEFWDVKGCPLARALRQRFRRTQMFPARKFRCVYSPQLVTNRREPTDTPATGQQPNGTVVWATAAFGLRLAQLAVSHALR